MPTINSDVIILSGLQEDYNNLQQKDDNAIYFTTDTKKIYVGSNEYCSNDGVTGFNAVVVEELPNNGEESTIYFTPRINNEENNIYDEYIYVNNNYEKIGSTDINLQIATVTNDGLMSKEDKIKLNNCISKDDIVVKTSSKYDALEEKTAPFYFIIEE